MKWCVYKSIYVEKTCNYYIYFRFSQETFVCSHMVKSRCSCIIFTETFSTFFFFFFTRLSFLALFFKSLFNPEPYIWEGLSRFGNFLNYSFLFAICSGSSGLLSLPFDSDLLCLVSRVLNCFCFFCFFHCPFSNTHLWILAALRVCSVIGTRPPLTRAHIQLNPSDLCCLTPPVSVSSAERSHGFPSGLACGGR